MDTGILTSIKKLLGIDESYTAFDTDIIIHINTVLGILTQLGVGTTNFSIEDDSAVWSDFIGEATNLEMIKSYVYFRVRLMFDPPTGTVLESMNNTIKELEWRISVTVDPGEES